MVFNKKMEYKKKYDELVSHDNSTEGFQSWVSSVLEKKMIESGNCNVLETVSIELMRTLLELNGGPETLRNISPSHVLFYLNHGLSPQLLGDCAKPFVNRRTLQCNRIGNLLENLLIIDIVENILFSYIGFE
jgi:hypothetical protein